MTEGNLAIGLIEVSEKDNRIYIMTLANCRAKARQMEIEAQRARKD